METIEIWISCSHSNQTHDDFHLEHNLDNLVVMVKWQIKIWGSCLQLCHFWNFVIWSVLYTVLLQILVCLSSHLILFMILTEAQANNDDIWWCRSPTWLSVVEGGLCLSARTSVVLYFIVMYGGNTGKVCRDSTLTCWFRWKNVAKLQSTFNRYFVLIQ